jgi:acetoacetyl-CoA synthetase
MTSTRQVLWTPSPERAEATRLAAYMRWLDQNRGLTFADYPALWEWSVSDLSGFWSSIVQFFDMPFSKPWESVITDRAMYEMVYRGGTQLCRSDPAPCRNPRR